MGALDKAIREAQASAYVAYGSSENPDVRYLTRFRTDDPIIYLKKTGGGGIIIVGQMEVERAARESPAAVMTRAESGLLDILKVEQSKEKALAMVMANLAGGKILIPSTIPYAIGRELEQISDVVIDSGTISRMRAVKTLNEIDIIRRVQNATDKAMEVAAAMIRNSRQRHGILMLKKAPLTSESVRAAMHCSLLEAGCTPTDTIVSCGLDTAIPHVRGTGPLMPDQPIVIDIFPRDERTGYYSDMTRTFVKGEPDSKIQEMYDAVRDAQNLAQSAVTSKISGAIVHGIAVKSLNDAGFESNAKGFIHNLGHGVGLEVHELPTVGPAGGTLASGNIITIEPGLYYKDVGGVRLENIGLVKSRGFECFTKFGRDLKV
ncbi:MAG: Xaa-Pro peptidase family protein [Methanoregulaceae archaeon]|nr:Xaa-Pro peptidase family protein [Methanoregulaceae archaeon]